MKIKSYLFIASTILLQACNNGTTNISGTISQMPEQKFYIEELAALNNIPIDSGKTEKGGKFKASFTPQDEALYRVKFQQGKYILLALKAGDKAKIEGIWTQLENYKVTGSASSESLKSFLVNLRENINDVRTLQMIIDTFAKNPDKKTELTNAQNDLTQVNRNFIDYVKKYADTTKSVASALFAANIINPQKEGAYIQSFYANLQKRFPKSRTAAEFLNAYNQFNGNNSQATDNANNNTLVAKDFSAVSPEGKTVTLSSFKGKYVLLDFWASWCGPCRQENPNVVKAYNLFKDKNFDILGLSLDTDREKWIQAIANDKLTWKHASELKGWASSIARKYNVKSIPQNFLIDPNGNIIASGLRGEQLITKLKEVLASP